MTKVVLNDISSGFASTDALNTNFQRIEEAFDNTLSLDGSVPNSMNADLDMNSKAILNLPAPATPNSPLRLADIPTTPQLSTSAINTTISDSGNYFASSNVEGALQEAASFLQTGTGAVLRPVQNKLREVISVTDFGATGDGSTDDTAAVAAAITSGAKALYFPEPSIAYKVSALTASVAGQTWFGAGVGSVLLGNDPTLNTITVTADDVTIRDLRMNGSATTATNNKFAIFTSSATPVQRLRVHNVKFSGADASHGFTNAVVYDTACDDGEVIGCTFERLVGDASGFGYGVLTGQTNNTVIQRNKYTGTAGRGRHGVYLSAGSTKCKVAGNDISGANYEGITLNSQSAQPANADNTIEDNTLTSCCSSLSGSAVSGAISIFGHAARNKILNNTINGSADGGIWLEGTGVTDLLDTEVRGNVVGTSGTVGINLKAAVRGSLCDNTIRESSQFSVGLHGNIKLLSDGTTATSGWLVEGNRSSGTAFARSAFQLNSTAPAPSSLKVYGNKFDVCNLTDVELSGVSCAIDGRIRFAVTLDPPSINDGASYSTGYTIAGAVSGDICTATHAVANADGLAYFAYVSGTNSVTLNILNNSGGAKDVASGTLYIDVWKATP